MSEPTLSAVIVYGPPASGKTRNREAIAEVLRCTETFDGAPPGPLSIRAESREPGRLLILLNDRKRLRAATKALTWDGVAPVTEIHIHDVRIILGDRWVG
jgi:hypothetical protein